MALYNEERPVKFSQVKGQDKVVKILSHDMKEGIIHNAYLFCGTRGTGKTTIARILAQAVNCDHLEEDGSPCGSCQSCLNIRSNTSVDVFELDAASNNGVDDIRAILEKVQYKPINKKKVFILDEVHMLSTSASNALLKVLEEPPEDVIFILCTTERHKILPTIISRCACYEFEKISQKTICEHLADVCAKHGVSYEEKALSVIAKAADGAMRDALSILDKFISEKEIKLEQVVDALGMATDDVVLTLLNALAEKDAVAAVDMVKKHTSKGGSLSCLIEEIFDTLLDMIEFQSVGDENGIVGSDDYVEGVVNLAYKIDKEKAFQIMSSLRKVYQLKTGNITFAMITAMIGAIYEDNTVSVLKEEVDTLKRQVSSLEGELRTLKEEDVRVKEAPAVTPVAAVSSENERSKEGNAPHEAEATAASSENPEETPSGAYASDEDGTGYDPGFLYENCMKEFDSLPDDMDSTGGVTESQTTVVPAPQVSLETEASASEPAVCNKPDSGSDLDSGMQKVPDNLSFDELANMAASGAFDDVSVGGTPACDNGTGSAGEGEASIDDVPLPDTFGDAFARLFYGR